MSAFDFNTYQQANRYGRGGVEYVKKIECADGFSMSVQASEYHYCRPRSSELNSYEAVEVGSPSDVEPDLMPYVEDANDPTGTVYGYVPVDVINAVVAKHGGLKV